LTQNCLLGSHLLLCRPDSRMIFQGSPHGILEFKSLICRQCRGLRCRFFRRGYSRFTGHRARWKGKKEKRRKMKTGLVW